MRNALCSLALVCFVKSNTLRATPQTFFWSKSTFCLSILCLAGDEVCDEKTLKLLSRSVQRYYTGAVQSDMWLPQFFFNLCVFVLLYDNTMALQIMWISLFWENLHENVFF